MTSSLKVSIVTPRKVMFEGEAVSVIVPAFDGELGVLPGHAPLAAALGCGVMRVRNADGQVQATAIRGGFLRVRANEIRVLTEAAVNAEQVDRKTLDRETTEPKEYEKGEAAEQRREERAAWRKAQLRLLE
jgi:F-type H+-transporting ATPase subunit epsilon